MKQKVIALLLLFVFLGITLLTPPLTSFANTGNSSIPLSPGNWQKTGESSILSWKNNAMVWQPKENNACITCSSIPENWSLYSELKISYKTNQPTSNWITILLYDQFQNMKFTYFTVSSKSHHREELALALHTLFSAFGGDPVFRWDKIKSISVCTHPTANQKLKTLSLEFFDFSLLKDLSSPPTPFLFHPPYPVKQHNAILFPSSTLTAMQTEIPENSRLQTILDSCFEPVNPDNKSKTEVLRDKVLQSCISKTVTNQDIMELLVSIKPSYWDDIYNKNDIFIQENAIQYLLAIDLLRKSIQQNEEISELVQMNLQKICSIEYNTCHYWINHYPYGKGNNHVTRAASILGLTSLFIHDLGLQKTMLQFSLLVLDYYFQFQIGEDGVLNEGTHYYTYLMEIFIYFAHGMNNVYGLNLFKDFPFSPRLTSLIQWAMWIQKPSGYLPSIDDSWQTRVVFPFRFYAPFFPELASELLWRSTCYKDQKPIYNEPWNIVKSLYIPLSLLSFPFEGEYNAVKPETKPTLFASDSQYVFHGLSDSYIAFTGKRLPSLHEQNDCGNIYIEYRHQPILLESGYGPFGWTSENRQYYVSSSAHNVTLIDGVGAQSWYNGGVGPIDKSSFSSTFSTSTFSYSSLQIDTAITHPDVQTNRTLIHSNPGPQSSIPPYYLILDSFHSNNTHTYTSIYHPNGTFIGNQSNSLIFDLLDDSIKPIDFIQIVPGSATRTSQNHGWFSAYWDQEEKRIYYTFSKKEKSTIIETLIALTHSNQLLTLRRTSSTKGVEYLIEQSKKENDNPWEYDLFLINDAKIMAKGKKILTNGIFSFARTMKNSIKPTQYYVADASYLNLHGKPVFYSNHPIQHLYYSHENTSENSFLGKVEGLFQDDNNVVSFFLDPNIQIKKVMLDNMEIQFRQHTEKVTIDIPSGKHFLTFE